MPNCAFYAAPKDHESLLTWLFSEDTCHVYELGSDWERPLRQFHSASEVLAQFDRRYTTGLKWDTIHLKLYVLGAGPPFEPHRISLDPKYCDGATFRYGAEGWGLIQFYLGGLTPNGLVSSHTNHNSQRRAEVWSSAIPEWPNVALWDFNRITSFSSRLNREVRKRSVGKIGSQAVLPGAANLWNRGTHLLPYKPETIAMVPNEA